MAQRQAQVIVGPRDDGIVGTGVFELVEDLQNGVLLVRRPGGTAVYAIDTNTVIQERTAEIPEPDGDIDF